MTDRNGAAGAAFETWCEIPHTRHARADRRKQWGPFLAGWIASQAYRQAALAAAPAPAPGDPDRRCDSRQVDAWNADCTACGAIEGEACRAPRAELLRPDSRKNSQTLTGTHANLLIPDELHKRD